MLDAISQTLNTSALQSWWFAPLLAFLGGVLTSITPCALTNVTLILGYLSGARCLSTRQMVAMSLVFTLGNAMTFVILGLIASFAGGMIGTSYSWWNFCLGTLMVLMALQIWGLLNVIPQVNMTQLNIKAGYAGAIVAGVFGGVLSAPCATPVLVILLGLLVGEANYVWGLILMFCYSLGHGVLTVVAGSSLGIVTQIANNPKYGVFCSVAQFATGAVILTMGLYMFYLGL